MNDNFANREVCDLIFVDYTTKKPFLNLDFANTNTTDLTGESTFAYGGKGHPKRIGFHGERGGTMKIDTQIQTMKLYSLISGGKISTSADFIKREVVACTTAGEVTATGEPTVGTVVCYAADDDCGAEIAGTYATSGKKFTATQTTDIAVGTKYVLYYMEAITTGIKKINIKSTTFPDAYIVYANTYDVTEDDEVVPFKMIAYKCTPKSNISIGFSNTGDPSTLSIECDLMADGDDNILDLIVQEEND